MDQKQKLLGYYNYTVILTYIGMLTGFIGIVYAFEKNTFGAVICLMIAGFCDMFVRSPPLKSVLNRKNALVFRLILLVI